MAQKDDNLTKEDLQEIKDTGKAIKAKLTSKLWWVDNTFLIAIFALILYLALTGYFTDVQVVQLPCAEDAAQALPKQLLGGGTK